MVFNFIHKIVDAMINLVLRRTEKLHKESTWDKQRIYAKRWEIDSSLSYDNIRKHHLQKTIGELMYRNGLDNAFAVYQHAHPEFKIGQKISNVDLEIMRMNRWWVSGLGPEGFEDRFHGVLISGRCHNCGYHVEQTYGCPRCRTGADIHQRTAQKIMGESTFWDQVKLRELSKIRDQSPNWLGATR